MPTASLTKRGWLIREFDVELGDPGTPPRRVRYSGWGIGFESVYVDGDVAARPSSFFWFVPALKFSLDGHDAVVRVRVGPFLTISSFSLEVDGLLLYLEH